MNEYDFPQNKLASVQAQLERLVEKNYYLHQSARDAYRWVNHSHCVKYEQFESFDSVATKLHQ